MKISKIKFKKREILKEIDPIEGEWAGCISFTLDEIVSFIDLPIVKRPTEELRLAMIVPCYFKDNNGSNIPLFKFNDECVGDIILLEIEKKFNEPSNTKLTIDDFEIHDLGGRKWISR